MKIRLSINNVVVKAYFTLIVMGGLVSHIAYAATDIYRCQLEDGTFQYQQTACSDKQVSGNSKAHRAWRSMRELSAEGQSILQRLGPDVESIKQCDADMRKYQSKLNSVNKMLRNVQQSEQPLLFKSYSYLQDCAECRTSAASACQLASDYLDQAMKNLMKVSS
jgi:hypothetical protein